MSHIFKILLIHNYYTSQSVSGENIVFDEEVNDLKLALGAENVFTYSISNNNINKYKLFFQIWFSFKHYKNIKELVQNNQIDIVHVHNFFPLLTPSIFKAAKDAGAKVVHTLHNYRLWCISGMLYQERVGICEQCIKRNFPFAGIFNKCYRKSLLQSFLAQSSFWFYKFTKIFDNIDYFFVLTNFQKEKVEFFGLKKEKLILKQNSLKILLKIQKNKDKNNYIYVGRLEESKGIYELLKVWVQLENKFILTIIGSGDIENNLKKEFQKENIIFKGKLCREEALETISKSKYLIQPSKMYETFGLTIIEAMSFGVPVIGFNQGTRKDFIKDGINGFLSNGNNLKEIIMKSYDFLDYEYLSNNAFQTAKQFEKENILKIQIESYQNMLRK